MKTQISTLELVVQALKGFDMKADIVENNLIKKGEPVVSIMNTDYFIVVKEKKNSRNIFFLYEYNENDKVKSKWLLGSIDILDVIKKIKELKNN